MPGELPVDLHARRDRAQHSAPAELAPTSPIQSAADAALVEIPEGVFWMGSAADDGLALDSERPRHQVRVSGFHCMKYDVTRRLWLEVMGEEHGGWNRSPADDRPIANASWYDAVQFCNQLSRRVGLRPCYRVAGAEVTWASSEGFRLPTEAEWEYVCRAGTETRWSCGNDQSALADHAWYGDDAADGPRPVGRKLANAWGLHDMHGNIWEWCWDWYAPYPAACADEPCVDPRGPARTSVRVLRGGSFAYGARMLRSAHRLWGRPGLRFRYRGFRCVRGPG